jgi:hypothetical protein
MNGSNLGCGFVCVFLIVFAAAAAFYSAKNPVTSQRIEAEPTDRSEIEHRRRANQETQIIETCRQLSPELQSTIEKTELQVESQKKHLEELAQALQISGQTPAADSDYRNWEANQLRCQQRLNELRESRQDLYFKKLKLDLAPDRVEQADWEQQIQRATRKAMQANQLLQEEIRKHDLIVELSQTPKLSPPASNSVEHTTKPILPSRRLPLVTPAADTNLPASPPSQTVPPRRFVPPQHEPVEKAVQPKRTITERLFGWMLPKRTTRESR